MSAFWTARRRRIREEEDELVAERAMSRWAAVGGLKLESRMVRWGVGWDGGKGRGLSSCCWASWGRRVQRIWKGELEDWKWVREREKKARRCLFLAAMVGCPGFDGEAIRCEKEEECLL